MYARDASNRANSWAAQRSQAIEKAKQLREERKFNLAKAGEMSVANEMGSNNFGRITSPDVQQRTFQNQMASDYSQRKPATMTYGMAHQYSYEPEEDAMQAKNSLMMLKSKMKDQTGYANASRYSEKEYEKPRQYQTNDGYQYMDYNKGTDRRGVQDRNYNDNYQAENNNYRRVFKPTFGDQQGYSQGNSQANQGYSKGNTYSSPNYNYEDRGMYKNDRASPFSGGNNEYQNYQAQNYAPTQQYRQQQSLGANKYSAQKDPYQQHPSSYDDFPSYQSKNIPSRNNNKNTMNMDRASPYDNNVYDSQYSSQPKYGQRNAMEDEYPSNKNYYGKAYEPQPQPLKNTSNNLLQRNKGGYEDFNQKPIANKGWQNSNEYEEDDRDTYQSKPKPQSKPQPKPQSKPQPQPSANTRKNGLPPPGPRQKNGFGSEDDNRPIRAGNDELPPEYANTGPLEECPYGCGRSFTAEALDKHANICQKVFQSKRKQFNTAQQRMTEDQAKLGYENKYNPRKAAAQKKPAPSQKAGASGKPKWKAESEIFRANLKAARGGKLTEKEEVQIAQAAQASSDMLVQCHSCGRRFNEVAAARHIPHCESKQGVRNPVKVGKNRRY